MTKVKRFAYALLLSAIGITTTYSQDTASEYVAPPDAGPKGGAPSMKVQLLNPGDATKRFDPDTDLTLIDPSPTNKEER